MKNHLALCLLLFTSALHAAELELTIKNLASDKGQVFFTGIQFGINLDDRRSSI